MTLDDGIFLRNVVIPLKSLVVAHARWMWISPMAAIFQATSQDASGGK